MLNGSDLGSALPEVSPGHTLPQRYYTCPTVFSTDMRRVVVRMWLLVDHVSRIAEPDCYFLVSVGDESIIVVRESDEKVNAFFNVCRHRGSRVCSKDTGRQAVFTCSYHAWTYKTNGSLIRPRSMPDDFDPATSGLHPCHLRIWHGMIFICLERGPAPPFEREFRAFDPWGDYHGFGSAKIAHKFRYRVAANWKLVAENFLECYHCGPAHPEFCTRQDLAATRAFGSGPSSGPIDAALGYSPILEEWEETAALLGRPRGSVEDDEFSLNMKFLMQRPHRSDILSETEDGRPVARVMGKRKDYDGGHMHLCFNPLGHIVSCSDYAVLFRFTPHNVSSTDIELTWLVDDAAEDVDVSRLTWMWDTTTKQDQVITENNFQGVNSSRYEPGRYSDEERKVATFVNWYVNRLNAATA